MWLYSHTHRASKHAAMEPWLAALPAQPARARLSPHPEASPNVLLARLTRAAHALLTPRPAAAKCRLKFTVLQDTQSGGHKCNVLAIVHSEAAGYLITEDEVGRTHAGVHVGVGAWARSAQAQLAPIICAGSLHGSSMPMLPSAAIFSAAMPV